MKLTKLQKEFWPWQPPIGVYIRTLQNNAEGTNEKPGALLKVKDHRIVGFNHMYFYTDTTHDPSATWVWPVANAGITWERI
jgi:hypothetical protein